MIRSCALFFLVSFIVVRSESTKSAVKGGVDCETANGKRSVAGIMMNFMEWDMLNANDLLNTTTTTAGGNYYLEGEEDEAVGKTLFFTQAWFPCSGPVFDQCTNNAYHSQCDALKPRKNCFLVIDMLQVPTDKYYVEAKDKNVHDAGRFTLAVDPVSLTYMKCLDN
ncbi:hypothetical protein PRIPAC_91711 [Pristionchus pacificus]|uniref:Uncharacterized protein n=1 Tax=Pristionchus pacificus TaxID=54126 RepID=A0A2A6BBV1_PRIPA|nr:hypothetical protein PRIPAC_91711 [Pristionchus pacificus]|eukprot:PDM63321.1 hypothetical protein PRIPAC_50536 [Pristionchus pacificus]